MIVKPIFKMLFNLRENTQSYLLKLFKKKSAHLLKISSSVCAIVGGVTLAINLDVSKYGFMFLALSSSQLFISSYQTKDYLMMFYAGSIFLFVDLLGVYRWLLA